MFCLALHHHAFGSSFNWEEIGSSYLNMYLKKLNRPRWCAWLILVCLETFLVHVDLDVLHFQCLHIETRWMLDWCWTIYIHTHLVFHKYLGVGGQAWEERSVFAICAGRSNCIYSYVYLRMRLNWQLWSLNERI